MTIRPTIVITLRLTHGMYRRYFHNGNFREFLHTSGGEFLTFRTGIPGGLAQNTSQHKYRPIYSNLVRRRNISLLLITRCVTQDIDYSRISSCLYYTCTVTCFLTNCNSECVLSLADIKEMN